MVLVIFNVAQRRLWHTLTVVLWTPKVHCGGKGVNKERRKWVMAPDLTRPGPRPSLRQKVNVAFGKALEADLVGMFLRSDANPRALLPLGSGRFLICVAVLT